MASYANPPNLNRYSYVMNNPLRYTDPTGHMRTDEQCGSTKDQCDHLGASSGWNGKDVAKPAEDKDKDTNNEDILHHDEDDGGTINWNAVVDPLAWTHIAEGILGGAVIAGFGVVMVGISVDLCVGSVPLGGLGCVAGIPVGLAGVGAVWVGSKFIWSGIQFTKLYLNDIFEVKPPSAGDE